MFRVFACITQQHDLPLVGLAVLIAAYGSYAAVLLLRHVRGVAIADRARWLAGAALAFGSAVWATHFIAMLAFQPSIKVGYAITPTFLSLVVAIVVTGAGLAIAADRRGRIGQAAGGVTIGLGTTAMHYLGMSAMQLPGYLSWDKTYVAASLILSCVIAAMALPLALSKAKHWHRMAGAGVLALSIGAAHFTGMAAVELTLDGISRSSSSVIQPELLAAMIAVVCLVLISLGALAVRLDVMAARQKAAERANIQSLADIAVEGLLICDGDAIVAVNASFEGMSGRAAQQLVGNGLEPLFDVDRSACAVAAEQASQHVLLAEDGERIPVELIHKPIVYAGRAHQVVAVRDLRERRNAEEIRFLAHHDALTGLANRVAFNASLERHLLEQQQRGEPFALFALDLDRFKAVNDTLGHPTGDLLLKRVSARLGKVLRKGDLIARLGGDEFAVLSAAPISPAEAGGLARRIVEMLRRPYILDGKIVTIGASVGVALAPQDGSTVTTLLKHADLALYRAKAEGRNTACLFEQGMEMRMQHRRSLELDLRQAVANDQIEVFYQPMFDVASQQVSGFEALVRWHHPEWGLIAPGEFIPLAEETGLIVPIGETVLRAATQQAARWGGVTVAINLSAIQFSTGDLVGTVRAALDQSGLPAWRLELEITESVLVGKGGGTLPILHALRAMGVRICLDNFGAGPSSLRTLRAFSVDKIKIDGSFVHEMASNAECGAIIGALIGLGRRLGITTTAEWVETEEQLTLLTEQGCNVLQGDLIGRPHPAEEAGRHLSTSVAEAA